MSQVHPKIIFFTGAPLSSSLAWEEETLSAPLQSCFREKAPKGYRSSDAHECVDPVWRILPLKQPHLPTGFTQLSRLYEPPDDPEPCVYETSFLSTANVSLVVTTEADEAHIQRSGASKPLEDDSLTQYYEHSFAVHEGIPSSQLIGPSIVDYPSSSTYVDYSLANSTTSEFGPEALITCSRLALGHFSELKEIPNAAYLRSINPQTMTVNLVVGIISISRPRLVTTRKGGRQVELVEMLVGDFTTAGFGISIWLPTPRSHDSKMSHANEPEACSLRAETLQLRPRDIVLARTVALSSFRGKVHGQSLRRGMTTLDLLFRITIDNDDKPGAFGIRELEERATSDQHVDRTRKVKDWVMQFVGANSGSLSKRKNTIQHGERERRLEALPVDTQ